MHGNGSKMAAHSGHAPWPTDRQSTMLGQHGVLMMCKKIWRRLDNIPRMSSLKCNMVVIIPKWRVKIKMADFLFCQRLLCVSEQDTHVYQFPCSYSKKNPMGRGFWKFQGGAIEAHCPAHGRHPYQSKELDTLDLCIDFHDDTRSIKPSKSQMYFLGDWSIVATLPHGCHWS